MSNETEEYLLSHGLKNALYTIRASDLKEDLFGTLVPCPFQVNSSFSVFDFPFFFDKLSCLEERVFCELKSEDIQFF